MLRAWGAAIALVALLSAGASAGDLVGEVTLDVEGARLADLGPTVVFLEPTGSGAGIPAPAPPPVLRQRNARFDPSFLVLVQGQSLEFANDDTIFHNVFSFSKPNDFDLGLYPAGESRRVRFGDAGLVKIYCSIHESMNATLLVVPTPLFALAGASGGYRVERVPAGRYRVTVWNERLPSVVREVSVGAGAARLDVALGGVAP